MRTKLRLLSVLGFASAMAVPGLANAQEDAKKPCEPGSWFCGDTDQSGKLQPLPADKPADAPAAAKPADATPPPVVVYQPPPPTVIVQPRDAPPPYVYVPRKAPPKKEWGLNLHLAGTMMGRGAHGDAGMGILGAGLRFRPIPQAALELNVDFAGGKDYNGFDRHETAGSVNGLIFLNPKSVTQVYLLGGFGISKAWVDSSDRGRDLEYSYFGVQGGLGLEFRLSRVVALNIDVRGLVRGRTDDDRRQNPEFVSGDGKSTNTSGAGILQGGITFYW